MATCPYRSRAAMGVALAFVLVDAACVTAVAAPAARYALRGAQLEALPPAQEAGRFRLRAHAEPARLLPLPAVADTGSLKLTATLTPKALAGQCPLPGSIFFDGFDPP